MMQVRINISSGTWYGENVNIVPLYIPTVQHRRRMKVNRDHQHPLSITKPTANVLYWSQSQPHIHHSSATPITGRHPWNNNCKRGTSHDQSRPFMKQIQQIQPKQYEKACIRESIYLVLATSYSTICIEKTDRSTKERIIWSKRWT